MKKLSFTWLFVGLVVAVPVSVFAVVKWYQSRYEALPVLGPPGHVVGGFQFQNQKGEEVTGATRQNKIVVSNFFFTHCPVVCPRMMRNLKTVQRAFVGDEGVRLQSFSVDPERDSVAQLSAYAARMDVSGNWSLLTGNKKEIYKLARKSFFVDATDGDGGPQDFIHSDKLILTDGQGRIRGYYSGTEEAEAAQLIKDVAKLKREK